MRRRLSERWRLALATMLNRAGDTCWGALAGWVAVPNVIPFGTICNLDCQRKAWCGKCFDTERLPRTYFLMRDHFKPLKWFKFKPILKLGHALGFWTYEAAE